MSFDVEAATAVYIDDLGEEALAQAAAYTTGCLLYTSPSPRD